MISTECSGIIIGPCDPGSKLLLKEFKITFLSFFPPQCSVGLHLADNQLKYSRSYLYDLPSSQVLHILNTVCELNAIMRI